MAQYRLVGKSPPRPDSLEKATGQARYTTDIALPGMLTGKVLRSTLPHARIRNIDTHRAARLAGVKAIVTAQDAPRVERTFRPFWQENRIFSPDRVRYVGDEVAALAAVDEALAQEALELIQVDYEELPPVFDAQQALKPDAPRIHDQPDNIAAHFQVVRGDPDQAFEQAYRVFEDRAFAHSQHQCYLEPLDCVASFDATGKLTLYVSCMDPSGVRVALAEMFGLAESRVRVIQAHCGGAFGGKISTLPLYGICALLSQKTGKAVKMVNDREEEFTATLPRVAALIDIRTGVDRDGTLLAKDTRIVADNGAYIDLGPRVVGQMIMAPDSLYRITHLRAEATAVYTNKAPVGAFRGFGQLQMLFALESHLDRIARELSIDPVELRLKNAIGAGEVSVHGWQITSCGLRECITQAAQRIGWQEKKRNLVANRGLGLACAIYYTSTRRSESFAGSVAHVTMSEDGKARVISGEAEYGQGWITVAAQIAAEELTIPFEDVQVSTPDTDVTPYSMGPWGLRVTISGGNAVRLAAASARGQLLELAATMLEANVSDLELKQGKISVRGTPAKAVSIEDVARHAVLQKGGSAITGTGIDEPDVQGPNPDTLYGNISPAYSFAAQAAEVEIDPETGRVKVIDLVSVHDMGQVINRAASEGQVEGGLVTGIGYALSEEFNWEGGIMLNPNFLDYRIPTAQDVPPIQAILLASHAPNTVYGAKSIGQLSTMPAAAVLANALQDAQGIKPHQLPLLPSRVLNSSKRS
jgi:CO/xanthine dehydrogenase Mo-binding subunit